MSKYYTGIGSRDIPDSVYYDMSNVSEYLATTEWTLRSGKAKGSDEAFQIGVQRFISSISTADLVKYAEIYIPWKGFKGGDNLVDWWDIVPPEMDKSESIAEQYHPAWSKCSQGARKMHSRNVNQVLGIDLETPSEFVLFYAQEKAGVVKGGTATAVNIARDKGIPTINMFFDDWKPKLREVVFEGEVCSLEETLCSESIKMPDFKSERDFISWGRGL